jgi:hypothetical protein
MHGMTCAAAARAEDRTCGEDLTKHRDARHLSAREDECKET